MDFLKEMGYEIIDPQRVKINGATFIITIFVEMLGVVDDEGVAKEVDYFVKEYFKETNKEKI